MKKFLLVIRPENRDESNKLYRQAIQMFGGEVVEVNDSDGWDSVLIKLKNINGILLPGGDDVGKLDFLLIEYALINKVKLLGICQGMQSMALYGSDDCLVSIGDESHYLRDRYCHEVELEKDSILYDVSQSNLIWVNSYHHQTVMNSYKFRVVGRSFDGLIEAIESYDDVFQVGVQWHPERMIDYDEVAYKLIEMFITK